MNEFSEYIQVPVRPWHPNEELCIFEEPGNEEELALLGINTSSFEQKQKTKGQELKKLLRFFLLDHKTNKEMEWYLILLLNYLSIKVTIYFLPSLLCLQYLSVVLVLCPMKNIYQVHERQQSWRVQLIMK